MSMDRTGTLKQGEHRMTMLVPYCGSTGQSLALADAAAPRSGHHLATAIPDYTEEAGMHRDPRHRLFLKFGLGVAVFSKTGEMVRFC